MNENDLTPKGRKWAEKAERAIPPSLMAGVALHGRSTGWPEAHINAAIKVCNEEAERRAA